MPPSTRGGISLCSLIYSGKQLYVTAVLASRASAALLPRSACRPASRAKQSITHPFAPLTAAASPSLAPTPRPHPARSADANTLDSYGVKAGSTLHMVLALRGGL